MKNLRKLSVLILCALLLAGCGVRRLQEVRVSSARIVKVLPEGIGGPAALVELGIRNPSVAFELTELTGLARYRGQDMLLLEAGPIAVAARSDEVYSVPVQGRFAEGFNPLRLVRLITGHALDYDDVTVSLRGKITLRGGIGKNIELEEVPLRTLLEQIEQAEHENE